MDDAWERVVEAALDGQGTRSSELRVLNLDGAVKSLHGCLPPAGILERFPSLEHLSIANVGVLSLEKFPRLRNLQRLILSDNRIAGGLENLVQAGLHSLRDLDLSNNRIQYIEDLAPLAKLHLVSLDLYECPVTRVNDYRSKVFSMIRTLKYLDKLDANEDERPETDDDEEEEDEEDEEYDYDDFDPGSGEVDGDDRAGKHVNGSVDFADVDDVIVDADEDEESDADEDEMETSGRGSANGFSMGSGHHLSNGFRVAPAGVASVDGNENGADEDVAAEDDDDDDDLGEEIDEEDGEDTDVVDVHNVFDSNEEDEDGVDDVEDDEVDIDEEDDDEDSEEDDEVDVDEYEVGVEDEEDTEAGSSGRLARFEEEIDGHEHGEEDENGEIGLHDDNGEIGEEDDLGVQDRDVEEEFGDGEDEDDLDGDYLVQPIARPNGPSRQSDFIVNNEEDSLDADDDGNKQDNNTPQQAFYNSNKRRRDDEGDLDDGDDDMELRPSSKRH